MLMFLYILRIHHMQQQVRLAGFFQSRTKGRDQVVRQMPDETNGICQYQRTKTLYINTPQGWIQGREQLIGNKGISPGHRIKQRRFTGIGVTHQRHGRHVGPLPCASTLVALPLNLLQPVVNHLNACIQHTPVRFQLGFTRPTQTNTTLLPFQMRPATDQAGGQVLQLRQFNLQLAFKGTCALCEDIQNQPGPCDYATGQQRFKISFLTRTQGVVKNNQLGIMLFYGGKNFFSLAFAHKEPRFRRSTRAGDRGNGGCPGCDLDLAELRGLNLPGANFEKADLRNANLKGASLAGANFVRAGLQRVEMERAQLTGANFSGARMRSADLEKADVSSARFEGADLRSVDFAEAVMTGADFSDADLRGALLRRADVSEAVFRGAKMDDADLERSIAEGADFSDARLSYADLGRVRAKGASFRDADLTGVRFSSADLTGADLTGANLDGAHLHRANLSGADLTGAQGLEARRLAQACGDAATKLPEGFSVTLCGAAASE